MTEPLVKILLVDDLPDNLLVLKALLSRDGVELMKAQSAREALELLLVHDFALALLDVQMPELDGFELAELMRGTQRTQHVPIIFVTAGPRDTKRVFRGYEVGATDFLFKPIDPILLGHKVATFVELHRQRLKSEKLAAELGEMLHLNEMFVAAVTHDLRSPLSTVVTGEAILSREELSPMGRDVIKRISSSTNRMVGMLDQLNDLARARLGGGITLNRGHMSFRAITDRVIDDLRIAHPNREISIRCEGATEGNWDEVRLAQVMSNLLGNALRHGTREAPIVVTLRSTDTHLTIDVHNGGVIPEEVQAHLFDPFRGSRAQSDNLGLGLYIVSQIMLAHGGNVSVESKEGLGTTFRLELPRTP